jgi:hypothetical protein
MDEDNGSDRRDREQRPGGDPRPGGDNPRPGGDRYEDPGGPPPLPVTSYGAPGQPAWSKGWPGQPGG